MKQKLEESDWEFLSKEEFLLASDGEKAKPSDLYFPSSVTKMLHLRTLHWNGGVSEQETAFLKKIGVNVHPQLNDLLKLACNHIYSLNLSFCS